ncbi:hypothetical protein FZEAL_5547 [Fusarium zealandicum]|uniref:Aminoglycoside phosphotransferase domain-containing protein n=1 Tax=Fusarium zealandicum TaxID=1053134 RepID=A0A8H4UJX9_9HYPO|nr:hypothetical protein FZEAL_5547 [Fusarium zealandicum]
MSSRLRDMALRDQRKALFGDFPPSPRKASPCPEGEVIYGCLNRSVVRHGNIVTKYTKHPDGMGVNDQPNEVLALQFVKDHTTLPVPKVISSDWDRITMEYVQGQTLKEAWPSLEYRQRSEILVQLKDYLAQIRSLKGLYLGRLDGQGVVVPSIMTRSGSPFPTMTEFHDWLVRPPKRIREQSVYWHQITTQLGVEYPIVFPHGDISPRNIIVRDGHIVARLDWEWAGWYPEYWDYVFAMRGLDNVDWETLGSHIPSPFTSRHDLDSRVTILIKHWLRHFEQLIYQILLNTVVPLLSLESMRNNGLETFEGKVLTVPAAVIFSTLPHLYSPGVNMG